MLYVKTKVAPSGIHGLGLFADEYIPRGTVIWRFTPGFDLKLTKDQVNKLPSQAREYFAIYAWLSKKSECYILALDYAKYVNHCAAPNALSKYTDDEEEVVTKAIKDISVGEEITDDYAAFDKSFDGTELF
jgi:hypothetical protein